MLSAKEIAERHGISKQAVSRRVASLVKQHDLTVERDNHGRIVGIDVAHYETLVGQVGDAAKRPLSAPAPHPVNQADSLDEARRQNAWINARRAQIELAQRSGELIRVDRLAEAIDLAGSEIATVLDRLPNAADDLAMALTEGGAGGLRKALTKLSRDMRSDIAKALASVADDAPARDDDLADTQRIAAE